MTLQQLIDSTVTAVALARALPSDSAQVGTTLSLVTDVLAVLQGAGVQGLIQWDTVEIDAIGGALADSVTRQLRELEA